MRAAIREQRVRVPLRPTWLHDLALALFVTVIQVLGAMVTVPVEPPSTPISAIGYALLVISGLAVVARRRRPVAVFVITGVASVMYFGFDFPDRMSYLALFVARRLR